MNTPNLGHLRTAIEVAQKARERGNHPFGERQYTVKDVGGPHWTFSQSIAS